MSAKLMRLNNLRLLRSYSSTAFAQRLQTELQGIRDAGTWKTERVITTKQDVEIKVNGAKQGILNFCANNYLGLSVNYLTYYPIKN